MMEKEKISVSKMSPAEQEELKTLKELVEQLVEKYRKKVHENSSKMALAR